MFTRSVGAYVAVVGVWAAAASIGAAQLKNNEIKPSRAGTYEVISSVSPDSAPPGGHGQVILIGENFKAGMRLQFNCKGAQFSPDSFKVESPTRIVAQVTVPLAAQEGPCGTSMGSAPGKEPFRISYSANMPVAIPVALLGEGDMQFGDIMMSMSKVYTAMAAGHADSGRIELDGGSIKYAKGGVTSFTESTSAVKNVDQVKQFGQSAGFFRIAFSDGKIYTFGPSDPRTDVNAAFQFLQKKLGK